MKRNYRGSTFVSIATTRDQLRTRDGTCPNRVCGALRSCRYHRLWRIVTPYNLGSGTFEEEENNNKHEVDEETKYVVRCERAMDPEAANFRDQFLFFSLSLRVTL